MIGCAGYAGGCGEQEPNCQPGLADMEHANASPNNDAIGECLCDVRLLDFNFEAKCTSGRSALMLGIP